MHVKQKIVATVPVDILVPLGTILGMGPAKERRRFNVTPSLIGRAHIQNDPTPLCKPRTLSTDYIF